MNLQSRAFLDLDYFLAKVLVLQDLARIKHMISCSSKGVVSGETHPRRIWAVCLSWRQHKHHCRGKCLKQESLLMQGIPQRGLGTRGHEKYRCETSVCAKRTQGAGSDSNPEPPPQTPELVLGEAWGICAFNIFFPQGILPQLGPRF